MGIEFHNCRPSGYIMKNRILDRHHCGSVKIGDTYNIKYGCNGSHGGFWGGFGAALGFGVGNMFGGLFGNIMGGFGNMFGGFGLGNMFGGFGMGMPGLFGGWGNLWGGGASKTDDSDLASKYGGKSKCDCECCGKDKTDKTDTTDTTDADCKKIADFQEEVNKLTKPVSQLAFTDLQKRIKAAKTESEKDANNKDANLKSYDELLKQLETFKPSTGVEQQPPVKPQEEVTSQEDVTPSDDEANPSEPVIPGSGYSLELLNGYSNYDPDNDADNLKQNGVILAHDVVGNRKTGANKVGDINNRHSDAVKANATFDDGKNYPTSIILYDKQLNKKVKYNFVKTVGGQYIYKDASLSGNDSQYYLLQKDKNGNFKLVQYDKMPGSGTKAQSSNQN